MAKALGAASIVATEQNSNKFNRSTIESLERNLLVRGLLMSRAMSNEEGITEQTIGRG